MLLVTLVAMPASAQIVATYGFDEGAATTFHDDSTYANDGALSSSSLWSSPGYDGTGYCLDLPGAPSTEYAVIPHSASLNAGAVLSISAWVNPVYSGGTLDPIVAKGSTTVSYGLDLSEGNLWFYGNYLIGGAQSFSVRSSGGVPYGEWSHVAVLYDSSHVYFYINGADAGVVPLATPIIDNNEPLYIGIDFPGVVEKFRGRIDDVQIGHCPSSNCPPTAIAGPDQTVLTGEYVFLDGSQSFDDTTAADDLLYSWVITSRPPTSQAILTGSTTAMPYFTTDIAGTYQVSLVVADSAGQFSAPSVVTIRSSALSPDCGWQQLLVNDPPARADHGMVFDSVRGVGVMFGGDIGGAKSAETWELSGHSWRLRAVDGPSARVVGAAMAFDTARSVTVLFGGHSDHHALGDTWEWDGFMWLQQTPSASPGPRYGAAMAFDSRRNVTVMFGGHTNNSFYGDTWEWDGSEWTLVASNGPSARYQGSMVYDAHSETMLLMGGSTGGSPFGDTWAWDGTSWTQVASGGPPPRQFAGMAHDTLRGRTVMFGGWGGSSFLGDTWEWDGTAWIQLQISGPASRHASPMVYDSWRHVSVLFGGLNGHSHYPLGDTWAFGCMPPDLPPSAVAGAGQSIRPGEVAWLDGSASYDDNTASVDLLYSWSFASIPSGSQTVLMDADTAMPYFLADVQGTYTVELVVADSIDQISEPSYVTVSSDDLAPIADAGDDQIIVLGDTAFLNGSGSYDPEDDPLWYEWTVLSAPDGSTAMLNGASTFGPSFVPDLVGEYELFLVASDFIGPGEPDAMTVTVMLLDDYVKSYILCASDTIADLGPDQVTTKGNQRAMLDFLKQALDACEQGDIARAVDKLEKSMDRTDGCIVADGPDGNGAGRDWITDCVAQEEVYTCLAAARDALLQ